MKPNEAQVYAALNAMEIAYERFEHPPVYTMADCIPIDAALDGTHCKNLFLCNRTKKNFYMLLLLKGKHFRTGPMSRAMGSSRLQMVEDELMAEILGVQPGAVSPFALLNPNAAKVRLFIDEAWNHSEKVSFHPCVNTASVVLRRQDFLGFLAAQNITPTFVNIDAILEASEGLAATQTS